MPPITVAIMNQSRQSLFGTLHVLYQHLIESRIRGSKELTPVAEAATAHMDKHIPHSQWQGMEESDRRTGPQTVLVMKPLKRTTDSHQLVPEQG